MIITDSQVALSSSRQATSYSQLRESLTFWQRDREPTFVETDSRGNSGQAPGLQMLAQQIQAQRLRQSSSFDVRVDISSRARELEEKQLTAIEEDEPLSAADSKQSLKIALISMLYEKLTGRKLDLFDASELEKKQKHVKDNADELHRLKSGSSRRAEQSAGWGMRYDRQETHYESEKVNFNAEASVKTADGKQIDIELELNLSREFVSQERLSIRAGDALKDPLVINYAGNAAELTQQKFSFDIDVDGQQEAVSFVQYGSGFLAYDRNGNQQIDDGSELFGARTGDGFTELAEYDQDSNGWIDENDAIYSQLKVWSKQPDGTDQLLAITKHNIGAIYLGRAATEFSLNDADNQQQGQLRSTGIYLSESGTAGTIQQIDLVA